MLFLPFLLLFIAVIVAILTFLGYILSWLESPKKIVWKEKKPDKRMIQYKDKHRFFGFLIGCLVDKSSVTIKEKSGRVTTGIIIKCNDTGWNFIAKKYSIVEQTEFHILNNRNNVIIVYLNDIEQIEY